MKKYQKETKSYQLKKKQPQTLLKETISIKQLAAIQNKKLKKKKRSNSTHVLKKSRSSARKEVTWNETVNVPMSHFGSKVVCSSKLKDSIIRTNQKTSDYTTQNKKENTYGNFYL
jgi:hypothetical protein